MPKDKFKLENLIVLEYLTCLSTRVSDVDQYVKQKIALDVHAGTWSYNGRKMPIGEAYPPKYCIVAGCPLIIGIYDRSNTQHLDAMVDDANKFVPPEFRTEYYED